jgi:riboflavin kinase
MQDNSKVIKLKETLLQTLIALAGMGAYSQALDTTTEEIGKELGLSQQTASRRLSELEANGWVTKERTLRGQAIRISKEGVEVLQSIYAELRNLFEGELASINVEGIVFSGMRDGAYYVTREGYRKQFVEKLGFNPYPGTLNLKLRSNLDVQAKRILDAYPGIMIEGYEDGQRTYGPVKCFKTTIANKVEGAILLIRRTHHAENVLEIISPVYLREKLGLKDGDKVTIKIKLNHKEQK